MTVTISVDGKAIAKIAGDPNVLTYTRSIESVLDKRQLSSDVRWELYRAIRDAGRVPWEPWELTVGDVHIVNKP